MFTKEEIEHLKNLKEKAKREAAEAVKMGLEAKKAWENAESVKSEAESVKAEFDALLEKTEFSNQWKKKAASVETHANEIKKVVEKDFSNQFSEPKTAKTK